jgi:DNA-binding transcriptional regulator of glucitol operon
VLRRYRFALRPGWLAFHLVTVAGGVTMVLLGRWQLHVSERKHFSIQNFGYSIQWWLFAGFAVFFWWRLLRDHARHVDEAAGEPEAHPTSAETTASEEPQVAYRRYVMPSPAQPADPVHAAYNDYLAQLAAKDAEER